MVADQSAVQQLLQSCGDDIKTALQRQDMKVDTFQVLLNNNSPNNEQQPGFWAGTQEHTRRGPADYTVEEDDIGIAAVQTRYSNAAAQGIGQHICIGDKL